MKKLYLLSSVLFLINCSSTTPNQTTELFQLIESFYEFKPFNIKIEKDKYPYGDDPKHQGNQQKQYMIKNTQTIKKI